MTTTAMMISTAMIQSRRKIHGFTPLLKQSLPPKSNRDRPPFWAAFLCLLKMQPLFRCAWHGSRYVSHVKAVATWIRECDEAAFRRILQPYPEVECWNARTQKVPVDIAGLLLTGGEDISREYLRQPVPDPSLIEDANPARDAWEFPALRKALHARLPILAICRGLQVLNVELGGTLHLDIPNHDNDKFNNVQPLRYAPEASIQFARVNSSHHQALDRLGHGLHVEAWHRDDNVVEQARLDNYPFCLAVQYHPERDALYQPLFDSFVEHLTREAAWA